MMHAKILLWLTIYTQYPEKNSVSYFMYHRFMLENFLNKNKKLEYAVCIFNSCIQYSFLCINNCTTDTFCQLFGLGILCPSVCSSLICSRFFKLVRRHFKTCHRFSVRSDFDLTITIHLDIHLFYFWAIPVFVQCFKLQF